MSAKRKSKTPVNGEVASTTNVDAVPDWKPFLSSYADKQWLRFANIEDLHTAIDMLWTAPFRSLPHSTPDGRSIVVPEEAVPYLARAGLKFTASRLLSISDFSPAEIRKIRK